MYNVQNVQFHIGLILQEGKVWMAHQIGEVQSIKIWVACVHGYFYNLRLPQPPAVVPGQGTELTMSMPAIPKEQPKLKVKLKAKETKEIPNEKRKRKEASKAGEKPRRLRRHLPVV